MAANDVATMVQFTDLIAVHVSRPTDPIRGYEEMTAPLVPFEGIGAAGIPADGAVVESEEYRDLRAPPAESPDCFERGMPLLDSQQMIPKLLWVERVYGLGSGARIVEDIMETYGDSSHDIPLNR